MVTRRTHARRSGFTLVELLVAAGMSIFIMVILTGAFQVGLETMRQMKAIADMQERLRAAGTVLRRDLSSQHFDGTFEPGLSGEYLGDQRLDRADWEPPEQGFFRIWQGSAVDDPSDGVVNPNSPYRWEGVDGDGIPYYIATDHMLHFTVRLKGNRYEQLFGMQPQTNPFTDVNGQPVVLPTRSPPAFADLPMPINYYNEWAEVAYFLTPLNEATPGGLQLYALRRRQLLAQPLDTPVSPNPPLMIPPADQELSRWELAGVSNTPADLTVPERRLSQYQPLTGPLFGDDVLLTDVLSFEVKATWDSYIDQTTMTPVYPLPGGATEFFDLPQNGNNSTFNSQGARVFDTWTKATDTNSTPRYDYNNPVLWNPHSTTPPTQSPQTIPLRIRIKALQIRIRVWDRKIEQARQITIVQDV